jgi:hypothetical protein
VLTRGETVTGAKTVKFYQSSGLSVCPYEPALSSTVLLVSKDRVKGVRFLRIIASGKDKLHIFYLLG